MFSLYIVIDHSKLLNSTHICPKVNYLELAKDIIIKYGGNISSYSAYLSIFPSNYNFSRVHFIWCLQELICVLNNNEDLVGYSLIVDCWEIHSEFEYLEKRLNLVLQTTLNNRVWLTKKSFKLLSSFFTCKQVNKIYLAPLDLNSINVENADINNSFIDDSIQFKLTNLNESIYLFTEDINPIIYHNILYWAKNIYRGVLLYIDFSLFNDHLLAFIDNLITLNSIFNPLRDLSNEEILVWGDYLELYNKLSNNSYDSFVLDDADIHFNKLIVLWFEAFTKRNKMMLVIKNDENMSDTWSILSVVKNLKILMFNKVNINNLYWCDNLNIVDSISKNTKEVLENKNELSVMVLFLTIITGGCIQINDILTVLKVLNYNTLKLREELDNYIRLGFLIGDNRLYKCHDNILDQIILLKGDLIHKWKDDFLEVLLKQEYQYMYKYTNIVAILGLNTKFRDKALHNLYDFIQKTLDLGRGVNLNLNYFSDPTIDKDLENILEYKHIRESRLENEIILNNNVDNNSLYNPLIKFQNVLNDWSINNRENIINRCKELYFLYQASNEYFDECRVKILFSLGLLEVGRVSESIDYLELNSSFSKSIGDTYSHIRSGCFLSMALFIKGDFTNVLRVSNLFLNHEWIKFKTRWFLYLKFIRSRALAELGSYSEAIELLESGIIISKVYNYTDILTVFSNWKGLFMFYIGKEAEAREILLRNVNCNESLLFLSEIEFLSNNLSKAIMYIDMIDMSIDDTTLYDENLNWRDGFFIMEEFFNRDGRSSILKQEITFFTYLLYTLNGDKTYLEKFNAIVKNISNDSLSLYNYKYLYYYYISTKNTDISIKSIRDNTLNKVVRLLQQRASNINAHNQKHKYFSNYWNSKINHDYNTKKKY